MREEKSAKGAAILMLSCLVRFMDELEQLAHEEGADPVFEALLIQIGRRLEESITPMPMFDSIPEHVADFFEATVNLIKHHARKHHRMMRPCGAGLLGKDRIPNRVFEISGLMTDTKHADEYQMEVPVPYSERPTYPVKRVCGCDYDRSLGCELNITGSGHCESDPLVLTTIEELKKENQELRGIVESSEYVDAKVVHALEEREQRLQAELDAQKRMTGMATDTIAELQRDNEVLEYERGNVKLSCASISMDTQALSGVSAALAVGIHAPTKWLENASGSILDCCHTIDRNISEILATIGRSPEERPVHQSLEDS